MSIAKIIDEANKRIGIKSSSEDMSNAESAIIYFKDKTVVISAPKVTKTSIMGKDAYMLMGDATTSNFSKDKGDNL
jgi:NACalpha-BTF3-like transcription factor